MSTTQIGIPTGTWTLDPVHSSIGFAVQYAGVGTFRGTFEDFDATLADGRLEGVAKVASLKVDVNQQRLAALGLNSADVNSTLSTAWGGRYVNDFVDRGRVKRVYVQSDAPYRAAPAL